MSTRRTSLSVHDPEVARRVRVYRERKEHPNNAAALAELLKHADE
jgi:hypothetical protein